MVYTKKLFASTLDDQDVAVEPLDLAETKMWIGVFHSAQDDMIRTNISAAREQCQKDTNRQFVTATWDVYLDDFPSCDEIELPLGSLQSITYLRYTDTAGVTSQWTQSGTDLIDSTSVVRAHIDTAREPARLVLPYAQVWPSAVLKTANPIQIRQICGYGLTAATVPQTLRIAMAMLIGHWYNHREAVVIGKYLTPVELPMGYSRQIANHILPSFGA